MKVNGVATMHAPADRVWAALTDPKVLAATIPGCERLETAGPDSYSFTVAASVASIHGVYAGEVSLAQRQQPGSLVLTVSGAGGPGTVSASVQVRLADAANGTTELSYDTDAVIVGLIAGVGQGLLSSVAKRTAAEFFSAVDHVLAGTDVVGQPAPPAERRPTPVGAPARRGERARFPPTAGFARGVLVGVAATLAGVAAGRLIGRRARS